RPFMSPEMLNLVGPQRESEQTVTHFPPVTEGWDRIIDNKLIEWGRDPSQLDEEGTITPSKGTIQFAIAVARFLRNSGFSTPTRVVPDAHGGIVFEANDGNVFETIRLSENLSFDYCVFQDCRLVAR